MQIFKFLSLMDVTCIYAYHYCWSVNTFYFLLCQCKHGDASIINVSVEYYFIALLLSRFWVAVRFQCLYSLRKFGRSVAEELVVNSGLLAWAFQSDCQDNILSSLLSANPSWSEMRNLGVGFWYINASQLRTRVRVTFLRNQSLSKYLSFSHNRSFLAEILQNT